MRKNYYFLFAVAGLIYILSTLLGPLGPNRYNLTPAKTHLLQMTVALPVLLIWWTAVYGAERFKRYTASIKKHADGRALDRIAAGLTILVCSYIFNGVFGSFRPLALNHHWLSAFTIISNYVVAGLALIAFAVMYDGSVKLKRLVKDGGGLGTAKRSIIAIFLIAVTAIYLLVTFSYHYRNDTPDATKYSSFYLPDILIILTLALPLLIGWGLAIAACFNISSFQRHVKGAIYKSALYRVMVGILVVVAFSVILQLLTAFSTFFAKAGLASILLILYLLILMYAIGFLIIASGVKKLNIIEGAK